MQVQALRMTSVFLCLLAGIAGAAEARRDKPAEELLKQMSDYLSSLHAFQVQTSAVDEKVTQQGQRIQFPFTSDVTVARPNELRVERASPARNVELRYDGKQFVVFDPESLLYSDVAAPPTLDEAIDVARDRYGIDAPAADLLSSHPYERLMEGVTESAYLGLESLDGVQCHHLAFRAKDVDWQIWVEDGSRPLPHRFVIVSKDVKGQPEFAVRLSNWKTDVKLPENLFAFEPPQGARRIPLMERSMRQGRR